MFARVISAQAGAEGLDSFIRLARQQLPSAQSRPGFQGFYLLTDEETGQLSIMSLWQTRDQMDEVARGTEAGIHDQAASVTGLTSLRLETFEVALYG